ncbi:T7SS effector LXG polymorphic toxin [Rathayibacter rathayi]|uniref:LXG domain-containing protein n=1 Tax=Rathayibacter rathayi TaxID=33887 RepID=A0ABD6W639_RATRA|nr:T7SS effector LXG polymorphic toxin [Rathayibacter rathayi]PPF11487.1 hypothetical protein C5C04_12155 [Rathayibacter rathayi]
MSSVVEFSADSWQASSPGLQKSLAERGEALDALLQGLVNLAESGTISGQGTDAMRAYIREVHVPVVQSLLVCLSTFQTAIGVYWSGYSQVDADGNFRLVNDEYDAHLTQLDTGIGRLRGFAADLRSIAASASHLVSLDGAGAGAADNAAEGFERMRSIAKTQQETWAAYEATDPGFGQVNNLVAEVNRVVANLGSLTVGQGRSYLPGSFTLTLRTLGELTGGMLEYCQQNREVASDGWQAVFSGYVDDVEAGAERQRKEDAVSGLLWDGLQIVAGAVVVAVGVVGTPFSAGVSLALAGLGGSLIAGGVNSAIDHATIASTGEGLNLVGMASQGIGQWYDVTLAQPAIASGDQDLQFLVGAGSGLGDQVSGALQLNMHDTVTGVFTLATNGDAFSQLWNQLTTIAGKAASGDAFVLGQIAGNLLPLGALTKATTLDNVITKADDLGGLITKSDDLGRLTTKADDLGFGNPVTIATASDTTSALDWLKNHLGAGDTNVTDQFTPTVRTPDGVDGIMPSRNPDWLNDLLARDDLPPWRTRVAEGQQFNYQNHHRYPVNELQLGNNKVLDSYIPGKEIVSRKNTQFAGIRLETGQQYIDEMLNKYPPGAPIKSGGLLDGDLILEVPVQNKEISMDLLEYAASKEPPVIIRDVQGKIYESMVE